MMDMIVKKSETEKYQYDIRCKFFVAKYRQIASECRLGINEESISWNMTYSQKFLCCHKAERVNVKKQQIKDISIKKVYARDLGITLVTLLLLLLYLAADAFIFVLAQGESEWITKALWMLLGACGISMLWYLVSRISVLQIKTYDNKTYRMPFSIQKMKNDQYEAIRNEILNELHRFGLK